MIRALLDTNVLISAFFWNGPPRRVVDDAIVLKYSALTSVFILQEVEEVLLRKPFSLSPIRVQQILRDILSYTTLVYEKKPKKKIQFKDKADEKIINLAIGAKVDILVTGDRAVLSLKLKNLKILSPSEFLKIL